MGWVIGFHTKFFDPGSEPGNPINPIAGHSLLEWLRARVPSQWQMSEAWPEDWGWACDATCSGRNYLIGACINDGMDEHGDSDGMECLLQVEKQRSFCERLMGRAKMDPDDPCEACLLDLVAKEPAFAGLQVQLP